MDSHNSPSSLTHTKPKTPTTSHNYPTTADDEDAVDEGDPDAGDEEQGTEIGVGGRS
ncbi:UNVERIFIED_CONTAM: hypothetical protein Sradi_0008300 [Sesamum radiatum]|uniref:Uncharacterized protein n=1 Tax=Sesamum radiatum TaxID=300843 RepID=A0AAW2WFV1_SESRA